MPDPPSLTAQEHLAFSRDELLIHFFRGNFGNAVLRHGKLDRRNNPGGPPYLLEMIQLSLRNMKCSVWMIVDVDASQ